MRTSCNHCTLHWLRHRAEADRKSFAAYGLPLESPSGSVSFPDGVQVEVGGQRVAWFAEIPKHCVG